MTSTLVALVVLTTLSLLVSPAEEGVVRFDPELAPAVADTPDEDEAEAGVAGAAGSGSTMVGVVSMSREWECVTTVWCGRM